MITTTKNASRNLQKKCAEELAPSSIQSEPG